MYDKLIDLLTSVGALIFYTVIYFLGYFATHGLNLIAGRRLFNRRIAGLVGVFFVAVFHSYKIISSPLPAGEETEVAIYALGYYVIFPVAVITGVFLYLMWQEKKDNESL